MARVFGDHELKNIKKVFKSKSLGWAQGGMVTKLDAAFARYTGAKYGICRNSAMTGLAQAVAISGAGCGDEVICDPLVHFGGIAALSFNCVPRFVDVKYDTYLMDPKEVEKAITKHTKALIVTNLWGLCAELDKIRALCKKHNIFMIEDCAHVIGAKWKNRHAGTYGDIGVFSFQQGKHICTGDGCVMITNRKDLHYKLYNEWAFKGESPSFLTLNFRMNEVTAAVGLGQLKRFPGYLKQYNACLKIYNDAIADCKWLRNRSVSKAARQSAYLWASLWEGDKFGLSFKKFKQACADEGVAIGFHFTERPAPTFDVFKKSSAYHKDACPVRCPLYKGKYRIEKAKLPVAADILNRVMMMGCVERPLSEARKNAAALKRAIKKTEE